ncbi:DUF6517 family protein [Haloarcula sp. S1CR25-12]|uniref:DUF6517 family protein n=1 Tax=Haloarcula saliterrae TaxID=2950534 RepID=A0ABU2FB51_9EURY|nr:DUF6517 family protein [Haloarcula sp. S1CR25-12]
MRKNRVSAVLAVGLVVLLSGCLGALFGTGATFVASEATVADHESAGFEQNKTTWINETRTYEAAGQEREVTVSSIANVYFNESVSDGTPRAAFAVVSTPTVTVAGEPRNPVGEWSDEKIIRQFSGELNEYGEIENLTEAGSENETMLGTDTPVTRFNATVDEGDNETRQVAIRVTTVEHEGDYVLAFGVYDSEDAASAAAVGDLFTRVEH